MENKTKTTVPKPNETSIQRDTKRAQGHRIWGGPRKKDIVATPISTLQASSIDKPSGMERAQYKMGSHPTPTVKNQVKHPKYSHSVKTSRLRYTRHALDAIPESEPQQELWASKLWASNPILEISSVPVQKILRISQLPKAGPVPALPSGASDPPRQQNRTPKTDRKDQTSGKVRASLHDGPLQETKALRISSKGKQMKERRSKSAWQKLLRSVNKKTFLRAVAYILPQLVCLQHHRGQVLPSLTGKGTTNLPGVRTIRNAAYHITNLFNTGGGVKKP